MNQSEVCNLIGFDSFSLLLFLNYCIISVSVSYHGYSWVNLVGFFSGFIFQLYSNNELDKEIKLVELYG